MNRYLALIIAVLSGAEMQAFQLAPRLVVNITIDQLRTDYLEAFTPLYTADGFRKLLSQGVTYEAASYPYEPVDRASAIATITTGTTPYYHGILGTRWLDRSTLRPFFCVDDPQHYTYYSATTPEWLKVSANIKQELAKNKQLTNDEVANMALKTITSTAMGADDVSDMISITLSATKPDGNMTDWQTEMESVYMQLDNTLGRLITGIEKAVGKERVLFVVTSTGYADDTPGDLSPYRIPTGTFYINRTANLLNMFLSAVYGEGRYIETCFGNQMYVNHKLLEQKRISISELLQRSQDFLVQNAGVADVFTAERLLAGNNDILKLRNGFSPTLSGDIIIKVAPGWRLLNEDTQETFYSRTGFIPFPIIFYGAGTEAEHVAIPVTTDRIAPTIAKSIRIRAPNACTAEPLF